MDRISSKDGCDREMNWLTVSIYSGESLCGQELKSLLGVAAGPNEPLLDLTHVAPPISSPATLHS